MEYFPNLLLSLSLSLFADEHFTSQWTPAQIPNCSNFFVADDIAQPNGSGVLTWNSRCGDKATATAIGASPTLTTGAVNSHSAVHFDSTPMVLNYTGTPKTFYVVARSQDSRSQGVMGGRDAAGGGGEGSYYFEIQGAFLNYKFNDAHVGISDPNGPTVNTWQVMGGIASLNRGTLSVTLNKNRLAGVAQTSAPFGSFVKSDAAVFGGAYYNGTPTDFCRCDIAALITYDRALTASEQTRLEDWIEYTFFGRSFSKQFYILAFSNANPNQSILEVSDDGVNFKNIDIIGIPSGRDPSAIAAENGYAAVTTYLGGAGVPVINLLWSKFGGIWILKQQIVACTSNNAQSLCYAPEFFKDSDEAIHVLAFNSPDGIAGQINEIHALAPDLSTWSVPVSINANVIGNQGCDPFMLRVSTTYHLFAGGCGSGISHQTSDNITGPWRTVAAPGFGNVEGVSIVQMGNFYRAYMDGSILEKSGTFSYSDSGDLYNWGPRKNINAQPVYGSFMQHGTVKQSRIQPIENSR